MEYYVIIVVDEEILMEQHYEHRRQVSWIIEVFMKKYNFDELKIKIEEYTEDNARFYYKDITKEMIAELAVSKF
jgi:hypothetical protein